MPLLVHNKAGFVVWNERASKAYLQLASTSMEHGTIFTCRLPLTFGNVPIVNRHKPVETWYIWYRQRI